MLFKKPKKPESHPAVLELRKALMDFTKNFFSEMHIYCDPITSAVYEIQNGRKDNTTKGREQWTDSDKEQLAKKSEVLYERGGKPLRGRNSSHGVRHSVWGGPKLFSVY
jgi:hypothetical protein